AGALPPTSGRVELLGQDITGADPARIARLGLARTYQNLRVFSDITVFDNVSVGAVGRQGVSLTGALLPWLSRTRDERIAEATLTALRRFDLLDQADQPA